MLKLLKIFFIFREFFFRFNLILFGKIGWVIVNVKLIVFVNFKLLERLVVIYIICLRLWWVIFMGLLKFWNWDVIVIFIKFGIFLIWVLILVVFLWRIFWLFVNSIILKGFLVLVFIKGIFLILIVIFFNFDKVVWVCFCIWVVVSDCFFFNLIYILLLFGFFWKFVIVKIDFIFGEDKIIFLICWFILWDFFNNILVGELVKLLI